MSQKVNALTAIPAVPDRTRDPQTTFNSKTVAWMTAQKRNTDDFNVNVPALNELFTKADQALDAADESRENAAVATLKAGEAAASAQSALESKEAAQTARTGAEAARTGAEAARDAAVAVAGVDIATTEKAGIVKPDGVTTEIGSDGTLSVPMFAGSSAGLVPASGAAPGKVLQGDGTWKDLPVFTGSANGLVPASGAAPGKALLGDGTWGSVMEDAASMTLSADLQLTADSPRAIVLTTTTTGLSVRLPDHSTLPRGTVFHIFVRASEDIQLCDFSGQTVKAYPVLSENTATRIQLIDASTGLWALASYSQWITSDLPWPRGLSIGDQFIFHSGSSIELLSMDILSEQKAIVIYFTREGLHAVVLSVSDTDIVVGDAVKVDISLSTACAVAALSVDKAVVCYGSGTMDASVLSIYGTTVTASKGTNIFRTVSDARLTALSAGKALVCCRDNSNTYLVSMSISGNTVTKGGELKIGTGQKAAVTALSETTALVCLEGEDSVVIKVSVSGNSIAQEASSILQSVANTPSLTALSEEKALVAYKNANGIGCVKVVTLSGSAVYVGQELECSTRKLQGPSVAALSEKSAVVCFLDADGPLYGRVYGLSINQDTIRVIEEKVFNSNQTALVVARQLSPYGVLVAFLSKSGTNNIGVAETITLL